MFSSGTTRNVILAESRTGLPKNAHRRKTVLLREVAAALQIN